LNPPPTPCLPTGYVSPQVAAIDSVAAAEFLVPEVESEGEEDDDEEEKGSEAATKPKPRPCKKRLDAADFRAALLSRGADPKLCSLPWVRNHLRWIVWKLAALERAFPVSLGGACLVAPVVLDSLLYRCERELGRGHRSHLARVLEGDAAAGSAAVFRVARVIRGGFGGGGGGQSAAAAVAAGATTTPAATTTTSPLSGSEPEASFSLELTDGWYSVRALCDPPLCAQLSSSPSAGPVAGDKVRVVGARLLSAPADALSACASSSLAVCFNGVHRVVAPSSTRCPSSDALVKLGRAPPRPPSSLPFAPLTAAAEDGGPIARTAVAVRRVLPELAWQELSDGRRRVASPSAALAAALAVEAALEAAAPGMAAALAREEREHREGLRAAAGDGGGGATAGEAAYARASVAAGDGEEGEGGGGIGASSRRADRALDAYCCQRETLRSARAAELQGRALAAAGVAQPVRSRRVWRALVSAAVPPEEAERAERRARVRERERGERRRGEQGGAAAGAAAGDGGGQGRGAAPPPPPAPSPLPLEREWLLQLWEPPTEDCGAPPLPREGQVVWLSSLVPRPRWRGDPLGLSRPQLSGSRATAWGVLDASPSGLGLAFECPRRRAVDLSGIASLPRGGDFDFEGVLVAAGPVRAEGAAVSSALASVAGAAPVSDPDASSSLARPPEGEQWLFCADAAALSLLDSGVPADEVWLLAVRVSGPLAAAPFLFPPKRGSRSGGGGSGGSSGSNPSSSLVGLPVKIRDARLALAPDDRERLWRAEARDTAVVALVGGGGRGSGGDRGGGGGGGGGNDASGLSARAVAAFGSRVAALLGS